MYRQECRNGKGGTVGASVPQQSMSQFRVLNVAPATLANPIIDVMQRGLTHNGVCDRTILPFGGKFCHSGHNRVLHSLVDDTHTALSRMETFLSFNRGTCCATGPILYDGGEPDIPPESVKGQFTIIRPKNQRCREGEQLAKGMLLMAGHAGETMHARPKNQNK